MSHTRQHHPRKSQHKIVAKGDPSDADTVENQTSQQHRPRPDAVYQRADERLRIGQRRARGRCRGGRAWQGSRRFGRSGRARSARWRQRSRPCQRMSYTPPPMSPAVSTRSCPRILSILKRLIIHPPAPIRAAVARKRRAYARRQKSPLTPTLSPTNEGKGARVFALSPSLEYRGRVWDGGNLLAPTPCKKTRPFRTVILSAAKNPLIFEARACEK